jgi:PAS domain S-box-containing protein
MFSLTQNNKIAVVAVAIFLVSFSAMILFLGGDNTSPDFLKSDVLEAAKHGSGHGVYFSADDHGEEAEEHDAGDSEEGGHEVDTPAEDSHSTDSHEEEGDFENMYRAVMDDFDKPIFVLEPEGKVKFVSKNFVIDYGYEVEEMKPSYFSYIYPSDLADFVTEYTSVIQSGTSAKGIGPYRFIEDGGAIIVHLVDLMPVVDDYGKVTEVIGCVKDITEKVEVFGESIEE